MNISTGQTENISEILAEIKFVKGDIRYLELLKKKLEILIIYSTSLDKTTLDKKEMKT